MGQGFARIHHIAIGFIIQQHDVLPVEDRAQFPQFRLKPVFQHPPVGGKVDLEPGFDIAQQFLAIDALAVAFGCAILSYGALEVLIVSLAKQPVEMSAFSNTFSPCQIPLGAFFAVRGSKTGLECLSVEKTD